MRYVNFILLMIMPVFSLAAEEFEGYNSVFLQVLDGEGTLLHSEEHRMLAPDEYGECLWDQARKMFDPDLAIVVEKTDSDSNYWCRKAYFSNVFTAYMCQQLPFGNTDVKEPFDEAFYQMRSYPLSFSENTYDLEITNETEDVYEEHTNTFGLPYYTKIEDDYSWNYPEWAPVYSRCAAKLELIGYNNPDYEEERFFDIGDDDQIILRIIVAFYPDAEKPIDLYERLIAEGRQE